MSVHHYPFEALRADYLRAGGGGALTGGLAGLAHGEPIAVGALSACALLFVVFGLRTWQRQRTVLALDNDGISTSGGRCVTLPWRQITAFKLRYFATKRDRTGGWMQLVLAAGRRRLAIESSLDGFIEVARHAARAAEANGLAFDAATCNNLLALGIVPTIKAE